MSTMGMYQLEEIFESIYLVSEENTRKSNSPSRKKNYWEYALKYCEIFSSSKEGKYFRLDHYRSSIGKITDENGVEDHRLKYLYR